MSLADTAVRELRTSIMQEGEDLGRHMEALKLLGMPMTACPGCGRTMMDMDEGDTKPTTRRRNTARRRSTTRRGSRDGRAEGDPSNRILELVMAGQDTGPKIAEGAKVHYRTALRHLEALAKTGAIRRQGQRSETRWTPTDAAPNILRERETATA